MPSDDQSTLPITKVTITSQGTTVTVEAAERIDQVAETARRLHTEAHQRCNARQPAGFGGPQ